MLSITATPPNRFFIPCQLRFHKVSLRSMIVRLTSSERADALKKKA